MEKQPNRLKGYFTPKDRFHVKCPNCKTDIYFTPSIFMQLGINMGSCNCKKCDSWLKLEVYDIKRKTGKATLRD